MSGDVSATEIPVESPRGEAGGLFTAFQDEQKASRSRWVFAGLAALVALVLVAGLWTLVKLDEQTYRVVTPWGVRSVRGGMTAEQVMDLLGEPITAERDATGAECYRYGRPSLAQPTFLIYSVCYEGGKLRDVTQRQYQAWSVDPATGTFQQPGDAPPAGGATPAAAPSSKG